MFKQRNTADQLKAYYGDAERALAAGDFFTAQRLAGGDPEITGICRVLAGNEVAGTAGLDSLDHPTPRSRLVAALGHWLLGRDGEANACLGDVPASAATAVLRSAMAQQRPRIALFSGTDKLDRFVAAVRASGHADLVTIGHRPDLVDVAITPADAPEELAAAVGPVDALYIDNFSLLPPQLAAIDAPKICHIYDLEHAYAARGRELDWIDWQIAIASGEHLEASLRYGTPGLVRGLGLTEVWPDLSGLRSLAESRPAARPIDILFTGGIDMPFYADKRARLARLAQQPRDDRIEIYGLMLDRADYFAKLEQARFVFSSTRSPNCAPRRLLESMAHGAMVLCEQDSSICLIFDTELPLIHHYNPDRISGSAAEHLDRYQGYRTRIAGDATGAADLIAQMPTTGRATLAFARYMTWLGHLTRAGLRWPDFLQGGVAASVRPPGPAVENVVVTYAAKHNPMQAYQPALRWTLYNGLTNARPASVPYTERMVALTSLAIYDRQEHLLRRQGLGRAKAAVHLMATLNRARRETPDSLLVWIHIAELLLDLNRLNLARRVLAAIQSDWPRLKLGDRPVLITPRYEFDDHEFVDGLIADHLAQADPGLFGPPEEKARKQIGARLAWLRARLAQQSGDVAGLGAALDDILRVGAGDALLMEQALMLATAGVQSDQGRAFLRRLCLAFLRGSRLCPRFLSLHFPLALQAMVMLDRVALARLMIVRFLRAKARVRLAGATIGVTEPERQMVASFGDAFAGAIATMPPRSLRPALQLWLQQAAGPDSQQAPAPAAVA